MGNLAIIVTTILAFGLPQLPLRAQADGPTESKAAMTPTSVVRLAHGPRPRRARPRRYVPRRRPPRRVYVAPSRVPRRPRRPSERVYVPRFHFGIGIAGTTVIDDNEPLGSSLGTGGGFDLSLGWRIASHFSLDLSWSASFHEAERAGRHDDAMLGSLSLDGRFFLAGWDRRLQPYVQVGVGAYFLAHDGLAAEALSGGGFQLGGGVDLYLTRGVSLGAQLLYRGAFLDSSESSPFLPVESAFISAFSYSGNIKFHF